MADAGGMVEAPEDVLERGLGWRWEAGAAAVASAPLLEWRRLQRTCWSAVSDGGWEAAAAAAALAPLLVAALARPPGVSPALPPGVLLLQAWLW